MGLEVQDREKETCYVEPIRVPQGELGGLLAMRLLELSGITVYSAYINYNGQVQ